MSLFDTIATQLTVISCCNCGMDFYLSSSFERQLRDNHNSFYCPMGHSQFFSAKSAEEKLQKEVERLNNSVRIEREYKVEYRERLHKEQKSKIAIKGHHTRLKKRIANGVCPCCKRTFKNLAQHMENKHPKFTEEKK